MNDDVYYTCLLHMFTTHVYYRSPRIYKRKHDPILYTHTLMNHPSPLSLCQSHTHTHTFSLYIHSLYIHVIQALYPAFNSRCARLEKHFQALSSVPVQRLEHVLSGHGGQACFRRVLLGASSSGGGCSYAGSAYESAVLGLRYHAFRVFVAGINHVLGTAEQSPPSAGIHSQKYPAS